LKAEGGTWITASASIYKFPSQQAETEFGVPTNLAQLSPARKLENSPVQPGVSSRRRFQVQIMIGMASSRNVFSGIRRQRAFYLA